MGHDPADRMKAMELAGAYGSELYTGVFYRNPNPGPTYDSYIKGLQSELAPQARPLDSLLAPVT
jgi:2-oxoglutarate/2-oxoacid ferredoxin oxidoreductase subunit beta